MQSFLLSLCKHDSRLHLSKDQLPQVLEQLSADVQGEMQRLIENKPPTQPRCTPRLLTAADVQPHEQMLVGQYGLFANRPQDLDAPLPTLSQGRILGLYMGAMVERRDKQALAELESTHPDYLRYAMDARRSTGHQVVYSGEGATNAIAFANTALLPGTDKPQYDHLRINTVFIPFHLQLTDASGQPANETVVAALALDNLFHPTNPNAMVIADYGDAYLDQFKGSGNDMPFIKQEPV